MEIINVKTICFHCGLECEDIIEFDGKPFCCTGCKVVYEILADNKLCDYYIITKTPGASQRLKNNASHKFSILDNPEIKQKLVRFTDGKETHVVFFLPQIHCSSCIWLLENLNRINSNIISSRVDFPAKEISLVYNESAIKLNDIADLLTSVGYEPYLNLNDITVKNSKRGPDRSMIFKLGIAGFCFGNIMMLSFPEYLSDGTVDLQLERIFRYLSVFLSLPVFFYSASLFYQSAWAGLKKKFLNIDSPIVLAILITFVRSIYEIVSETGAGYLDSMSGIVFFMLIGRYLQERTFKKLSFERDYKSYFPIGVTVKRKEQEENIPVTDLKVGERILIRNNELIPADSILFYGEANIDYSFVTGESAPVLKSPGEIIYAGGRQVGSSIEMEVVNEVSNSYLTELWNKDVFRDYEDKKLSFVHSISQYFTIILFSLAAITAGYWAVNDPSRILNAVSAMLIIACPCALLLSATFTGGNVLRIFGRNNFYLKNVNVIEMLAEADSIVFDKTGTITQNGSMKVAFDGSWSSKEQEQLIRSLANQSTHPYSKAIFNYLPKTTHYKVQQLKETPGKGLEGVINGSTVRLGTASFIGINDKSELNTSKVYCCINDQVIGCFTITNQYRKEISPLISSLSKKYELAVISGDNDSEQPYLEKIFGKTQPLLFNQTPEIKLDFIKQQQKKGKNVMMVGDGLNDAGALKQSNVGIAISDEINNFSPACDAILEGSELGRLHTFIRYARAAKVIVLVSFIISIVYNIVGLSFAVQGTLSPVIAAILMPASSVTIILFTTGTSSLIAKILDMK